MKAKIKILHIIKSLGRGGAEMLLPETLRIHDRTTFDFHYIYFLPWKDQMVSSIRAHGGKIRCIASGNNLQLILRLTDVTAYVRENKIDLIHAHLPWAGVLARLVGRQTGVPVIYTEHNKQERYHRATRIMNLATMNMTDEVIAVSADVENSIRRNKQNLRARVRTIFNGVNTNHFSRTDFDGNDVRRTLGIPINAPVIGTIAVFRIQKRLDLWLEQASSIIAIHPDTHFILVGDGPLRDDLLKKRGQLGLVERVHMPGLATEVRPYLASFDLFMMSSLHEGLPIALLEAMSMECAVVATTAGGIGEVVRDHIDGLLCSVDDPNLLSQNACRLLSDELLRKSCGSHARRRIEADFSMKRMVSALEDLYVGTMEGKRSNVTG